jgi:alkanesulfonate monooxygenase SsuD/methylene tetrahydromethanopterin reductase-like flavin-dependent oxidoreductase (luciferase family)
LANGESLVRFARAAEQSGIASLWVSDHVVFPRTATGSYPGGRFPHDLVTKIVRPAVDAA